MATSARRIKTTHLKYETLHNPTVSMEPAQATTGWAAEEAFWHLGTKKLNVVQQSRYAIQQKRGIW